MRKICLRCGSKFGSRAEYCPHDGSLLVTDAEIADPLLGTTLLEQFRIDEVIGTGGMGTVYRAHQTTVGRDVAIKVLRPELARDEQAVFRFEREARVAISLDHPNLVRVFLSGRLGDGRLYIVMELLEGRSLADELDEQGTPSLERGLIMIMKLCAGLGAVHAAGIVHRDIKPENIYLVRRGKDDDFVKLVDFGVARVLEAEGLGPATTQTGRVFGTAAYISPEAATGDSTDQRSDIYSLGVLTYQLMSGRLPFEGKTAGAVLMQHVHQDPPLLRTRGGGAEVPAELAEVVMRALSKNPEARQQNLAEFLDALSESAGQAGLLKDARALLLGTVWGDDLAAPGSYLAELLGSSAPPSSPPSVAATQPMAVDRDDDLDAFLSSAPKPFGTTAYDLAVPPRNGRGKHRWLWALLGLLGLTLIALLVGSLRTRPVTGNRVEEPASEPPSNLGSQNSPDDSPVVDIGTDLPMPESPAIVEPATSETTSEEPPTIEAERARPVTRTRKKRRRRPSGKAATAATQETTAPKDTPPASGPDAGSQPVDSQDAEFAQPPPEPDDGIDWTVPDFPDEPIGPPPEPSEPSAPPPPTGTPDAPARNPVVIDEPPPS